MIKNYFKYIFLLFLILSCGKKAVVETETDVLDANKVFFNVVYMATGSKSIGSSQYYAVQGLHELQFNQTDSTNASDGTFTLKFDTYKEPQLSGTQYCTAIFTGTFTVTQSTGTETVEGTNAPYNPATPYTPPITGEIATTNSAYFLFTLTPTKMKYGTSAYMNYGTNAGSESAMQAKCATVSPLAYVTLKLIRFPNGDIQVQNTDRGMQFYMIPEVL